jgi:hypothetical protein
MSVRMILAALALTAVAAPTRPVAAQEVVVAPLIAGHADGHFLIGGLLGFPLDEDGSVLLALNGGFQAPDDFEGPESWEYWEANVDLLMRTNAAARMHLFALGGFHVARLATETFQGFGYPVTTSWDTSAGVNLGGGFAWRWASVTPMLGMKFELKSGAPWVVFLAVGVPMPELN